MHDVHSLMSPSSSNRWLRCAASIQFAKSLGVESKPSAYAMEGTAVHKVIELCLKSNEDPYWYEDRTVHLEDGPYTVTHAMCQNAAVMVDYCRRKAIDAIMYSEIWLDLHLGVQGLDGGTCDCLIIDKDYKYAAVIDYKNGSMPVKVEYNSQLLIYAIGAIDKFQLPEHCIIDMVIVQPNCSSEPKVFSMLVQDIKLWRDKILIPKACLCLSDNAPFCPSDEVCKFCPCAGQCVHQNNYLVEKTQMDFSSTAYMPDVNTLTPEQKSRLILYTDAIENFLKQVSASVMQDIMDGNGSAYPHLKLVRKTAKRKFTDIAADPVMSPLLDILSEDELFEKKIKGITAIEKILKDRKLSKDQIKELMNSVTEKPEGALEVTSASDKREKVENRKNEH